MDEVVTDLKTAAPQHLLSRYYVNMQRQLEYVFDAILFRPLLELLQKENILNKNVRKISMRNVASNPLRDAIQSGRVQYVAGIFSGQFSAAISSELKAMGAVFNAKTKTFRLDRPPAWVLAETVSYLGTAKLIHEKLKIALKQTQQNLDSIVDRYSVDAFPTVDSFEAGFKETALKMEVSAKLSADSREKLAADYTQNMKLWIQQFSSDEIQKLRELTEANANAGYRYDTLLDAIKKRHDISARHAKFLARQETSLYMSKFRRNRFEEAGVTSYIWSTSHDERVRSSHRHLDGRVFQYADPPITDMATGGRNNPGEDFNCRCVDIAILSTRREDQKDEATQYRQLVGSVH